MLVLSRKIRERIVVGEDVIVTVLQVGRDRVKIGIEAPSEVSIRRGELCNDSAMERRVPPKVDADSRAIDAVARLGDREIEGMSRGELVDLVNMVCEPHVDVAVLAGKDHAELLELARLVRWGCRTQVERDASRPHDTNIFNDTQIDFQRRGLWLRERLVRWESNDGHIDRRTACRASEGRRVVE